MKIIVGFFTTQPGRRDDYLAAARDHLERSRLDPHCLYIEPVPMPDHPDRLLLAEAFTSEETHRRHEDPDHLRALWRVGPEKLAHVASDSVNSAEVEDKDERFDLDARRPRDRSRDDHGVVSRRYRRVHERRRQLKAQGPDKKRAARGDAPVQLCREPAGVFVNVQKTDG